MKKVVLLMLCALFGFGVYAQNISLTGKVTSVEDKQALPGVSVVVKGTTIGTVTNIDGNYTLSVPANGTLVFSFIGMRSQEIPVNNRSTINVELAGEVIGVDEVVVVGYGTQKKSVVTGAISSVKSSDIANMVTPRVEDVLKGRTSGVTVATSSGAPGASSTVSIRGITSINSASPLYVVDGVPVYVGGIDYLNQNDIESVEVLKDAASAAIYGTQAAAGVILITTKKGKVGDMKINYNGYVGTQAPAHKLNLLNGSEYATVRNEALLAAGRSIAFQNPQSFGEGTDWQSVIFNNNAPITNQELSFSGGNDRSKYYTSFGYFKQDGIIATDISQYKRLTLRLNTDHKMTKWLNFGENIGFSHINSKGGVSGNDYFGSVLASAINLDPTTPLIITDDSYKTTEPYASHLTSILYDDQGHPYGISKYVGQEMTNPAAYIKTRLGNTGWSENINGNVYLEIMPVKGLQLRSSMGVKLAFWGGNSFTPVYFLSNTQSNLNMNSVGRSFNRTMEWTWTNTASYSRVFGDHNFTGLLGTEARRMDDTKGAGSNLNGIPVTSWEYASMNFSVPASQTTGWGYENQRYRLASIFARVNYDYKGKYLFTGIIRRDGSSHFGSNNVYGYFPSVSVGWLASEEGFWKKNTVVNYLKVRAGYGVNGNDNLSPFLYTSTIVSLGGYTFGNNQIYTGYGPGAPANPDLKWEQTSQLNFGVDAILLKNFNATLELFSKKTTGMLMSLKIPAYVGAASSPWGNIASMENKGIEFELGYNKKFKDFLVNLKGNVSYVENEVTDLGNNDYLTNATMQSSAYEVSRKTVGQPVNEFYGFVYEGVFQTKGEINAYKNTKGGLIQPNAVPGDYKWKDISGDGSITNADRTWLGNPTPNVTYGFTVNLAYKGFDLIMFSQGVSGNKIFNQLRRIDINAANYMNSALARWTGPGTSDSYAHIVDGDPNGNFSRPSPYFLQNGAYFRIKTLQLGYTLPKSLLNFAGFDRIRVYVSGNNLLTLTEYEGYDPEIGGGQGIYSIDRGVYPQARSFMAGLDISF
jgi:TonB-dependent starch-binding outer membrane protein SusC